MGVTTHSISFENGYPILYVGNTEYDSALFDPDEKGQWKTVYFSGLDQTTGHLYDEGVQLDFMGTAQNDHICFIGLNLAYHYYLTHDVVVGKIMDQVLFQYLNEIPTRELVPISVKYGKNRIEITTNQNHVNTTLAYHDIFESKQKIQQTHHLLYVNSGTTVITMKYPYLLQGSLLSLVALIGSILLIAICQRKVKRGKS